LGILLVAAFGYDDGFGEAVLPAAIVEIDEVWMNPKPPSSAFIVHRNS
jgi:hypothetical protein